jgi:hypothetical protein
MLALVFAMITLQNAAPDPVTTPAASIGQRLTGQAPSSPFDSSDSAGFGNLTITAGCTYGNGRLGPSFYNDAADLTRTLTQPECTDDALPPTFGTAFVPAGFAPSAFAWSRVSAPSSAAGQPVSLTTTSLRSGAPSFSNISEGAKTTYVLQRLTLPKEFTTPVGPVTAFHATSPIHAPAPHRQVATPH